MIYTRHHNNRHNDIKQGFIAGLIKIRNRPSLVHRLTVLDRTGQLQCLYTQYIERKTRMKYAYIPSTGRLHLTSSYPILGKWGRSSIESKIGTRDTQATPLTLYPIRSTIALKNKSQYLQIPTLARPVTQAYPNSAPIHRS
jgi:hypothetical protein